jgi:hypothetical protein
MYITSVDAGSKHCRSLSVSECCWLFRRVPVAKANKHILSVQKTCVWKYISSTVHSRLRAHLAGFVESYQGLGGTVVRFWSVISVCFMNLAGDSAL